MSLKKPSPFLLTDEGIAAREALERLANDLAFNTPSSYSANSTLYPDNTQPFVEKHMAYLVAHPTLDPEHYVSNLRLKTRIR